MPLFEVNNLSFSYKQLITIAPISFSLEKKQFLSILGESGSGKSTLLKLFAGLLPPNSGSIFIDSQVVLSPEKKLIPGHEFIKLVTQDYKLNPNFSLQENICYQLRTFTKAYQQERSNYLLDLFRIGHLAQQLPRNVSGGERQRTAFACALAETPKLLLLDEPFSNLDNINKEIVKEALRSLLLHEDSSCILVTHDLMDAISLSQLTMVIKNGQVQTIAPSQAILHETQNEYVTEYIRAALAPYNTFKEKLKQS
jgi:ABC-type Fe3+/spermidine/putrescine transport system ATPase subunit